MERTSLFKCYFANKTISALFLGVILQQTAALQLSNIYEKYMELMAVAIADPSTNIPYFSPISI